MSSKNFSFWIVFLVSFIVYCLTCARHLSWAHDGADGGDLAICAYMLGVPHPTGYPLYCLLGWLFTHIFQFGEVAFRLNIFSAIFAALGAGIIALTLKHASEFIFPDAPTSFKTVWIPLVSGFTPAFSYTYWSQALIVEVYSLNAFFLTLIIYKITLLIRTDDQSEKNRHFLHAALITGFGFTNHLSILYPFVAALLTLAYLRYVPGWKTFFKGLIFFVLPLLLYIYLPLRSSINPVMDWGNPENVEGFIWVVLGRQFRWLVFSSLFGQTLFRIHSQINLLKQFGFPGILTAFIGIAYCLTHWGKKRLAFFIFITLIIVLNFVHIGNYLVIDPLSFMLPAFTIIAIFTGIGCGYLLELGKNLDASKKIIAANTRLSLRFAKAVVIFVPILLFFMNYGKLDLSDDTQGYDYAVRAFKNAIPGSVICEKYYGRGLTLLYYYFVEGMGKDKNITPVYIEQLQFWWGKNNFLIRHKNLDISTDFTLRDNDLIAYDFIERNYDKVTAIYFGQMLDPPDGYEWEIADDLYRIVKIE
ncbi:MAG: DUF2723 domain-containing protein [bacterium]